MDIGYTTRDASRGVPRLASPAAARAILERLQKMSEPYGTMIAIEQNVGVIQPKPVSTTNERSPSSR